jgi:hypothetical protein
MAATVYYILMAASLNWTGRLLAGGFILLASAAIGAQLEGRWRPSAAASAAKSTPSPIANGEKP